ncbi:MAG TPA: TlpA disulfide reductase family protein [Rudaea sp.]
MFNRTNLLIVAVAVLGAALGLLAGTQLDFSPSRIPSGMTVLKTGDARSDLHLPDTQGTPRRLSEWDGKLVLVNFWATWCGPCREEMPLLDQKRGELQAKGFEIVGIAIDDAQSVRAYLKDNPVEYPILVGEDSDPDPSLLFGDSRGVLPYSVLIGRDGRIVAQRAGSFSENELARWLKPHL